MRSLRCSLAHLKTRHGWCKLFESIRQLEENHEMELTNELNGDPVWGLPVVNGPAHWKVGAQQNGC
jgi:hypothetical protein